MTNEKFKAIRPPKWLYVMHLNSPPLLLELSWAPQRAPWFRSGVLSVFDYLDSINKDVLHAHCILVRILVGGFVGNGRGIEDNHIREVALFEEASKIEYEVSLRQTASSSHRFSQRYHFFLPHLFPQQ